MRKFFATALILCVLICSCAQQWERPKVRIGESWKQVVARNGEPQERYKRVSEDGISETWIYHHFDVWLGYSPEIAQFRIYFRNGRVESYQE